MKKYNTEEERIEAKKEYQKQWYQDNREKLLKRRKQYQQEHKEEITKYHKQYYQDNKEKIDGRQRQYYQEHKEEKAEWNKQYRQENPEKGKNRHKKYYQNNKEQIVERHKQYHKTPMGRACMLLNSYQKADKKYNRGECTLTAQWIAVNIFPKPCHWCGEVGWEIMGCDRIDNSLPHTPDNVIPCCDACNKNRGRKTYEEFKKALRAKETVL